MNKPHTKERESFHAAMEKLWPGIDMSMRSDGYYWQDRESYWKLWQEADVTPEPKQTLREAIDGATDENMHVWCKVSDVRAALDDAERYRSLVQIGVTETASIRERRNGCILWFGPSIESEPNGTAIYAAIKATP